MSMNIVFDDRILFLLYIAKAAYDKGITIGDLGKMPLKADECEIDEYINEYLDVDFEWVCEDILTSFGIDLNTDYYHEEHKDYDEEGYRVTILIPEYSLYSRLDDVIERHLIPGHFQRTVNAFIRKEFKKIPSVGNLEGCFSIDDYKLAGEIKGILLTCEHLPETIPLLKYVLALQEVSADVIPVLKSVCRHFGIKTGCIPEKGESKDA